MAITATVSIAVTLKETSSDGYGAGVDNFSYNKVFTFVDAAGALGCQKFFADRRTLNTTTENLDLSGSLASKLGAAVVLTKGRIVLGQYNGASGTAQFDFADTAGAVGLVNGDITLGAGGMFLLVDPTATGRPITATTADIIKVTTTASSTYDIAVGGE